MITMADDVHNQYVHVGNATLFAGEIVNMEELYKLPSPQSMGPRHCPVRFDALVNTLHGALAERGLVIRDEVIGLAKQRTRMVVALNLDAEENHAEFGMHIGMLSSVDQAWSNKFAFGTSVFVCANIALSAEFVFSRKSTRNAMRDFPRLMNQGIGRYIDHFADESRHIEHWMEKPLSRNEAKEFCWDALVTGVVRSPRYMLDAIWPRFINPTHEEHREGTVYALMNAFTGAEKERGGPPESVTRRSIDMMGLLKERFPAPAVENTEENIADMEDVEILSNGLN